MTTFPDSRGEHDGWTECWQCGGEGFSHHDCGEDTCCCLDPEDNVPCDICRGKGGWRSDNEQKDAGDGIITRLEDL